MEQPIINRVAQSQLTTIDPVDFFVDEITVFDLKDFLFMEMILKEKEFRTKLGETDWTVYEDKNVGVFCSTDAIIPLWAYMLVTTYLQPVARTVMVGAESECKKELFLSKLRAFDFAQYDDRRVVLKGCGDAVIPEYAYSALSAALLPYVKSIMYGEPCSTVPVFKRKERN